MKWIVVASRVVVSGLIVLSHFAYSAANAADTSAAQELSRWSALAGVPGNVDKGRLLFSSKQGGQWSCSSCHGLPPNAQGKHASSGKTIAPLAPAANPQGFQDQAKADKWFRRNCNDVLTRECTALEKADVLAYLLSVKP